MIQRKFLAACAALLAGAPLAVKSSPAVRGVVLGWEEVLSDGEWTGMACTIRFRSGEWVSEPINAEIVEFDELRPIAYVRGKALPILNA